MVAKKKIIFYLSILLIFLLLILILYPSLLANFSTQIPYGNQADTRRILGIISFSINTSLGHLYHLPILYPESYTLSRTHPLFAESVFFKLFQLMGFNIYQSNNLYIILGLVFGALGCFLLIGEFTENKWIALIFSAFYIIFKKNFLLFHWLNFISLFYIPFVFYFFIRYIKSKKKKYLALGTMFAVCQFLASIYFGIILWTLLIPSFFIFSLILKLVTWRDLKSTMVCLSIGFIVILIIFYPFIQRAQSLGSGKLEKNIVNTEDLFSNSRVLNKIFKLPGQKNYNLFPGYTLLLFVMFFLAYNLKKKKQKIIIFIILASFIFVLTFMVYVNDTLLEIMFLLFMTIIVLVTFRSWPNIKKLEKLMLLTFSLYFIIFLTFPNVTFMRSFSLYNTIKIFLPLGGLRAIKRVFLGITPFLICLAAFGGARAVESLKNINRKKLMIFSTLIVSLMILENFNHQRQSTMMQTIKNFHWPVYQHLPYQQNKIILEIPFRRKADYIMNWQFHRNYLVNGSTSLNIQTHFSDVNKILGLKLAKFPSEARLLELIHNYSVTHVVFHWNLLKKHRQYKNVKQHLKEIRNYGKIIYNDKNNTILQVQEFIPQKQIIRTYSYYHLKKNNLTIQLQEQYQGRVNIYLNNRFAISKKINSQSFTFNSRTGSLNYSGNRIAFIFNRPVLLETISLTKP